MSRSLRVLQIDDNANDVALLRFSANRAGVPVELEAATVPQEGIKLLEGWRRVKRVGRITCYWTSKCPS